MAEAIDKQKRSKTDPDKGFSSYEEASFRKYNQLVKQIKVSVEIFFKTELVVYDMEAKKPFHLLPAA